MHDACKILEQVLFSLSEATSWLDGGGGGEWRQRHNTIPSRRTVTSVLNAGDMFIKYNFARERRSLPKPI